MPTHSDAIGYLGDLAKEINEPWFNMICDLAGVSGLSVLDEATLDELINIYTGKATYVIKVAAVSTAAIAASTPVDFIEKLSHFTNFKLLGDTLEVTFKKRITLIFGANGSGKSSLCESLKALAIPEAPSRPLQNVRVASTVNPGFRYKFKNDSAHQAWIHGTGHTPRGATVKWFDTAIAIRNVVNAVEPGRVIALTPFRLHVFDLAKGLTAKFREALQREQLANSAKLNEALEQIRAIFKNFKGRPLSVIDDQGVDALPAQIKLGEAFTDEKLLAEKQNSAVELEKATSEEGLKLLRAEHRELETFLTSVNVLVTSTVGLWSLEAARKARILAEKQKEQETIAKALIPKDGTLDQFVALLRAASPLCSLEVPEGQPCPLCKRGLGNPEVEMFKRYHDLLASRLETEIAALKGDIAKAVSFATATTSLDRMAWAKCVTIDAEILDAAKNGSDLIVANCDISREPTDKAKATLEAFKTWTVTWTEHLASKNAAIETAAKGRAELLKQLGALRASIEPLEYAHAIVGQLEKLKTTETLAVQSRFWKSKLPAFTQVLRRITDWAKHAHEELVVADFESRLNAEYKLLTEKNMAAFGVILARKGADAAITVIPQIGGKNIEGVLSEGEQRVHALALFFAELETCPQSVLVFDDPISSFDYNYIANYCARLRDLTLKHPARQIIVLTHNWEFFVQLQTTLNAAGLDGHLSVQVLENCTVVADYSEKADDLKAEIGAILADAGEPTKGLKEEMAGKMRRLIESIVNTHVFNNQRHQYKQKSQPVSTFNAFTKLVPLLSTEASTLRDLFSKLSISEHDDPRNAYVNTDKATFQSRYNTIIAIEAAIIARR